MKKYVSSFIFVFFSAFSSISFAENPLAPPLEIQLNKIFIELGENLNIGLVAENLDSGKVLYRKNADRYFMRASNQKLLTAFAALEYLVPSFVFQRGLFADLN